MEENSHDRCDLTASGILLVYVLVLAGAVTRAGTFSWQGLLLMLCALGLAVALHLRPGWLRFSSTGLLLALVPASLAVMSVLSAGRFETQIRYQVPGVPFEWTRVNDYGMAIQILAAVGVVIALTYVWPRGLRTGPARRRWATLRFTALILIAVCARGLILESSPNPQIDVLTSQTLGGKGLMLQLTPEERWEERLAEIAADRAEAWTLRRSRNVYAMEFPSPYYVEEQFGPRWDARGQPEEGAWFDHYGYPPATVYANALSWWLFREVRVGWILCDLAGAVFIFLLAKRMSPGRPLRGELLALAFLFMPRSLYVIEQSWTEPLVVATLGAFALVLSRPCHPLLRGVLMGLWFSSKQYVALAAPLVLRLRRCRWTAWAIAAAVGLAVVAPFAAWDWGALMHDVFGFFLTSEGRPDALSIYGAFRRFGMELPWWLVAPIWLGGVGFFTWRMRRGLAGMLFGTASLWLFFFMLGKQAFLNYWYLILFSLLLAAAAVPERGEGGVESRRAK